MHSSARSVSTIISVLPAFFVLGGILISEDRIKPQTITKTIKIDDVEFVVKQLHSNIYLHSGNERAFDGSLIEREQSWQEVFEVSVFKDRKPFNPIAGQYRISGKDYEPKWFPDKSDIFSIGGGSIRFKKPGAAKVTFRVGDKSESFIVKSTQLKINIGDQREDVIKAMGRPDKSYHNPGSEYINSFGRLSSTSSNEWRWDKHPGLAVRTTGLDRVDAVVTAHLRADAIAD